MRPLAAALISGILTVAPFVVFGDPSNKQEYFMQFSALVLGGCVVVFNFWRAVELTFPAQSLKSIETALTPTGTAAEARNKRSTKHKVDKLVQHAVELSKSKGKEEEIKHSRSTFALIQFFSKKGDRTEQVGGFLWTWRQIRSQELFSVEGIRFSGRLLVANLTQGLLAIFVILSGLTLTLRASQSFDEAFESYDSNIFQLFDTTASDFLATDLTSTINSMVSNFAARMIDADCPSPDGSLPSCDVVSNITECLVNGSDYLCTLVTYTSETPNDPVVVMRLLQGSGWNAERAGLLTEEAVAEAVSDSISSLYPTERYMVTLPLTIGTFVTFFCALFLFLGLIPSATSTILKLRSGVIATLRDPIFNETKTGRWLVALYLGKYVEKPKTRLLLVAVSPCLQNVFRKYLLGDTYILRGIWSAFWGRCLLFRLAGKTSIARERSCSQY